MQEWLSALDRILDLLTLAPQTPMEKWVIAAVAILLAVFVYGLVASMTKIPNTDPARSTLIIAAGALLMMLSAIATQKHVCPALNPSIARWLPLSAAALALLAVVIPLSCLWQRSKYIETTIVWASTIAGATLAVFLISAVFDAVASGKKDAFKANRRNKEIEREFFR
jgi:CDP-diglyceride synthetase